MNAKKPAAGEVALHHKTRERGAPGLKDQMKEQTAQHTDTIFHKHKWPFLMDSLNYL